MKKLSKKVRFQVYAEAYEWLKINPHWKSALGVGMFGVLNYRSGLCQAILNGCKQHCPNYLSIIIDDSFILLFPELKTYKPKVNENGMYWFPCNEKGRQKRLNILQDIIKSK